MTLEELKETIKSLESKEVCELLSYNNCDKCFCKTNGDECIITIFTEGILNEIGNK